MARYEIIRKTNNQPEFQIADGTDLRLMQRTWRGQVSRSKRQGWKEVSRFFEHTSAAVRFTDGDNRSVVTLREIR